MSENFSLIHLKNNYQNISGPGGWDGTKYVLATNSNPLLTSLYNRPRTSFSSYNWQLISSKLPIVKRSEKCVAVYKSLGRENKWQLKYLSSQTFFDNATNWVLLDLSAKGKNMFLPNLLNNIFKLVMGEHLLLHPVLVQLIESKYLKLCTCHESGSVVSLAAFDESGFQL